MSVLTLTPAVVIGLFFIQRYRFLTIDQFSRAAGLSRHWSENLLFSLEQRDMLGHFGFIHIPGHGRTPKVYYLKKKGWELLRRESDIPEDLIGPFLEAHREATWSPQMYHRLRLLDLLISLEVQVRTLPRLNLVRTFMEYRRRKREGRLARETSDFVAAAELPENRIIPDAAFVLENVETERRALFFVEMDMATERIATKISNDRRLTIRFKLEQYDRYLTSGRFTNTYADFGDFRTFTLLFVTYGEERIDTIRRTVADLPSELHRFYRFADFAAAHADFLGPVWKSRMPADEERYRLVRE